MGDELAAFEVAKRGGDRHLAPEFAGLLRLALADARIGLAERDAVLPGAVHQPRVGREGDRLFLHCGIDNHTGEVGGPRHPRAGRDHQALRDQRGKSRLAYALAPGDQRGAVERQPVAEEFLTAGSLGIWILKPEQSLSASSERSCMCLRMVSPAVNRVGSGGWRSPSE